MMRPQGPREVTRQLRRLHLLPTQLKCPERGRRLSRLPTLCLGLSKEKQRRCWSRERRRTAVHPLHGHPLFTINSHSPPCNSGIDAFGFDAQVQGGWFAHPAERPTCDGGHFRDHFWHLGPDVQEIKILFFLASFLGFCLFVLKIGSRNRKRRSLLDPAM